MIAGRIYGQPGVVVTDMETGRIECELKLLRFQRRSIRFPQNRNQDLVLDRGGAVPPLNIEIGCVLGCRTVLQHIHPPGILRTGGHVIRNNVDQQAHARCKQLSNQRIKFLRSSEFGI